MSVVSYFRPRLSRLRGSETRRYSTVILFYHFRADCSNLSMHTSPDSATVSKKVETGSNRSIGSDHVLERNEQQSVDRQCTGMYLIAAFYYRHRGGAVPRLLGRISQSSMWD